MERLQFIAGPMQGHAVEIVAGETTVGREPSNGIVLQGDPGVSRQHARLYPDGPFLYLTDAGSANGTLVNGIRIAAPTPLRPGDLVQIASHVMRFEGSGSHPGLDPTYVFASSPVLPPEPPLPMPLVNVPTGHPVAMGQHVPPPPFPHHPPHPGVVVNQQVIVPDRSNSGSNWIWNLIGAILLGFCAIGALGPIANILVPGLMLVAGSILAVIGWMDYRRFSPHPEWYGETKKALAKLIAGGGLALLGLVWLGSTLLGRIPGIPDR